MKNLLIVSGLLFCSVTVLGQHDEHDEFHAHHMLSLLITHTHVGTGIGANGKRQFLSLPSWALNYNYQFHPKWAIGLHNDIIIEKFKVEHHGNTELERSYPVASVLVASFRPAKHVSFMVGTGGEFAHTGTYFLIRAGVEYSRHISKQWELNGAMVADFKANAYNSFAIGLGIARVF